MKRDKKDERETGADIVPVSLASDQDAPGRKKTPAVPRILKSKAAAKESHTKKSKEGEAVPHAAQPADHHAPAETRLAAGKALRQKVTYESHGKWKREKAKVDPLAILKDSDKGRVERLVPIRYGRMLQSPFTFFRGSAAVMAADLANTPTSGLRVQACGDCHLMNFGGFATPERNILFDMNDFDETLPAPWEWDLKRLAASFVLAARSNGLSDKNGRDIAVSCARAYRKRLRDYSEMSPLDIWYARITDQDMMALAKSAEMKERIKKRVAKALEENGSDLAYPQLAGMVGGKIRINDAPPLIYHPEEISDDEMMARIERRLGEYRETLPEDRRELLDRYRLVDGAVKVVGIGSVGTACMIILLMSAANEPLFLQYKEARPSVLEAYAGKSQYQHHGQRVVMGQRLTQPASDVFLGWVTAQDGRTGYVRQLRDAKIKPLVEIMDKNDLMQFGKACGWVLARAHAKSGDPLTISGYLGNSDKFDEAMGSYAMLYADQAERDHAALKAAVRAGKIEVHLEE